MESEKQNGYFFNPRLQTSLLWAYSSHHHSLYVQIWSEVDPNPRHTIYFKAQLPALSDPNEWTKFQLAMSSDLPVTFRVCTGRNRLVTSALCHRMDHEFRAMKGRFVEVKGKVIENVVTPLFRVSGAGYLGSKGQGTSDTDVDHCHLSSSSGAIYKVNADSYSLSHAPGLQSLHDLLVREVRLGHIVRQEVRCTINSKTRFAKVH